LGKWDFDGDEAFFFFVAGIVGVFGFFNWYLQIIRRARRVWAGHIRFLLAIAPMIAGAGLVFVLTHWADPKYVIDQLDYQLMFFAGGLMWVWLIGWMLPLFGMSPWDDGLERANPAAGMVSCGAILGAMAIYAGGNVGGGPTIWTTIFPAFVATVAWMLLWLFLELVTRSSDQIAIDRDFAGGFRLAGFLIAGGLILGRAIAGDWTSWDGTFRDALHLSWPLPILAISLIVLTFLNRPTPERPAPNVVTAGLIPALVFVAVAVGYLFLLGPADIGKHVITYEQYMGAK